MKFNRGADLQPDNGQLWLLLVVDSTAYVLVPSGSCWFSVCWYMGVQQWTPRCNPRFTSLVWHMLSSVGIQRRRLLAVYGLGKASMIACLRGGDWFELPLVFVPR